MSTHSILTIFDGNASAFAKNTPQYSWDNPYGGGNYWHGDVFMLTSDKAGFTGQGTDNLQITVSPGDTIQWFDTPMTQGENNIDFLIYGFSVGSGWGNYMNVPSEIEVGGGSAYVQSNFNGPDQPTFIGETYPENVVEATVKEDLAAGTYTVPYYLLVARINLSNPADPTPEGWYQIDPSIKIVVS